MQLSTEIEENEVKLNITTWINFVDVILSERSYRHPWYMTLVL